MCFAAGYKISFCACKFIATGKPRYNAGMEPVTEKYNGAKITETGHKTRIF